MSGASAERLKKVRAAPERLRQAGIAFQERNGGAHLLVEHNGLRVEFVPGSGQWWLANGYRAEGLAQLIRFLKDRPDEQAGGFWWYSGDDRQRSGMYEIRQGYAYPFGHAGTHRAVVQMTGRWARALNPFTGEAL